MKVTMVGFDRAAMRLALFVPEIRKRVQLAIRQTTFEALVVAESRVPRKTGELARTLRADFSASGMTGMVKAGYGHLPRKAKGETSRTRALRGLKQKAFGPQLPGSYAAIVEFGGKTRQARPYLVPAVEAVRNAHKQRIANAIRDGISAQTAADAARTK